MRLADGRIFTVSMQDGVPVVDWTGLIHKFEWPGFKPITFDMPFDGYVSLNIVAGGRHGSAPPVELGSAPAGKQTVQWDGLTRRRLPYARPAASGRRLHLESHRPPGAKLTFRGYACFGGRVPWKSSPGTSGSVTTASRRR